MKLSVGAFLFLSALVAVTNSQYIEPNCGDKQVIVHLFEWSWDAVAAECEQVLGPKGYCGVQVSPPNEHIYGDAWWTRYQPISYMLTSRSGDRAGFINMVDRCNAVGVNVIVDLVINHMSGRGSSGTGVGGSSFDADAQNYDGVPYSYLDFHQPVCDINNYNDAYNVRNCYLVGLNDLDGSKDYVRGKIADYVNDLIAIGVKGFRVDAAKHMWPGDLEAMQSMYDDTIDGNVPFIFHEVIDHGGEAVTMGEYTDLGKVTEFNSGSWLSCVANNALNCLTNYGSGLLDGLHALTFVDNHDNQRGHGGAGDVLTYKDPYNYKLATGFHLAHEYGFKRVMSSYDFGDDTDQGPPGSNANQNCANGWVCEHRWSSIMNMVAFTNFAVGEPVENWQDMGSSLGFSRGSKAFFAMGDLNNVGFNTGLPDGTYCDIIHDCAQTITVSGGYATISKYQADDPIVAFCVNDSCQ